MAVLYVVGTPIGNLGDITVRALETFKDVDVIACEDTRHTLELLTHFGIRKPLVSCRAQNEEKAAEKIIALLKNGKSVAYASDAGTPGISDPGAVLAERVRAAGFHVVPIPGVSALTALMSVAGQGGKTLIFEGFLSPSPGKRRKRLKELLSTGNAIILYESPHRILKLLSDLADIDNVRRVVVGRELTKLHEEIVDATAADMYAYFAARESIKGECAIFVSGVKNIQLSDKSTDN
ncbi:MAG: 16S rRNA (cytidine(1402)-2'-O)-methyltransferase [Treponema sp.]|nr:16S rRNA (cytidine(1402)-2'-O)-methyltransferase [Treponema sp.]